MSRKTLFAAMSLSCLAAVPAAAATYAIDYIASAASATVMDPSGSLVAGSVSLPPSCTGCSPRYNVPVLWSGSQRFPLAVPPGRSFLAFANATSHGWVAGTAYDAAADNGMAMVWRPRAGGGFEAVELGVLPSMSGSIAVGIDERHRVVGTSLRPYVGSDPFVWEQATGIRSLTAAGFVPESPLAVSPGGTVATRRFTYRLGDPASTVPVAPAPAGFAVETQYPVAVNDRGDRATFLLTSTSDPIAYAFRYRAEGSWQMLSAAPNGRLSRWGVGSIDAVSTITGTVQGAGVVADGPDGTARSLATQVSPAYRDPGATTVPVGVTGDKATDGRILAQVAVGRSWRLAKLVPVQACEADCLRVATLAVGARAGRCTAKSTNRVTLSLQLVDERGAAVANARVSGRVLDDGWTDLPLTLTTDRSGRASWQGTTPACSGAVAFLVEAASSGSAVLDRSRGVLARWVIPQP